MRILISADMEGTCGVSSWVHVEQPENAPPHKPNSTVEYERFRLQMTREVNAAIEGAIAGGASDIIVNDSHDGQRNILLEHLHKDVRYISGADKPLGMMQGIDQEIDAVFYTGYHARAGTPRGPLAHTWNLWVQDVRFNGVSTGEYGVNAAIAGAFDVPVVLVAGDDQAVSQTQEFLGDQVQGAVVKTGVSSTAAIHLHPEKALEIISAAARRAVQIKDARPYVMEPGTEIEIDADHQSRIDQMLLIPGCKRIGARTIGFTVQDGLEFNHMFRLVTKVGNVSMFS